MSTINLNVAKWNGYSFSAPNRNLLPKQNFICVQYEHVIYTCIVNTHIHATTPHLFLFGGVWDYFWDTTVAKIFKLHLYLAIGSVVCTLHMGIKLAFSQTALHKWMCVFSAAMNRTNNVFYWNFSGANVISICIEYNNMFTYIKFAVRAVGNSRSV